VTTWATIAAVTLGCAHPDPALTTPAAPVSVSVALAEATPLKASAFYLYLLTRSQ